MNHRCHTLVLVASITIGENSGVVGSTIVSVNKQHKTTTVDDIAYYVICASLIIVTLFFLYLAWSIWADARPKVFFQRGSPDGTWQVRLCKGSNKSEETIAWVEVLDDKGKD